MPSRLNREYACPFPYIPFPATSPIPPLALTLRLTRSQDYPPDHPEIALLRLRNYTMGKKLLDEEVLGEGGLARIADLIGVLVPFVRLPFCFALDPLITPPPPPQPSFSITKSQNEPQNQQQISTFTLLPN